MAELTQRLQAAVGAAYRIERELGGGGMSRVFLADEPALGRRVVIKVLPPEMAAGVNRDRFQREIQLAARLQHPHIVQLLAAGSADDLLWYIMPFIEGESLRVRLARQSELPVKDVVRILREVADALSYAHEQGVIHRDIKPDNVLLAGRHALVTDFGVAKAVSESSAGATLTSLGLALGTPAYMAPEQASGDPHVDHRADLYALGATAYEMLCGRPPFSGPNPQAVLAAHVTQAPALLTSVRPTVPPALNAIVMRCLEKRAADRWQSADELTPHLEALLTPSGGTTPTAATAALSLGTESAVRRAHPLRVAAFFALAALLALSLTWWLTRRLGLPDWVLPAAIVLLVIGLPIVIHATRRERERAQARTAGQAIPTPSGPLGSLSTFRGAVGGGILAFAGLLAGAGAFMGLRAAGVGPFATLMSAGVLNQRDRLLLADFANRTTDSTLDESVTAALRIDLTRSTVVRLLEAEDIAAGLERMQRQPGTVLTADLARELAEREGAKGTIVGEVSPLGSGFVLTASILGIDGTTLLAVRETAADPTQLIGAVDQLSKKLREGIGESLKSIRSGEQLEQVTTSSLDALRLYTRAERLADQGRDEDARAQLEEVLQIDSSFAMAWRKLGVVLSNTAADFSREVEAVTRAYQLRHRLPERERLLATAYYFSSVELDRDQEIKSYEQLLARWPDDLTALNNLAIAYLNKRRFRDAEAVAWRGLEISPTVGVLWANFVTARTAQGNYAAADSAIRLWKDRLPGHVQWYRTAMEVEWARGDYAAAERWADTMVTLPQLSLQAFGRNNQSVLALLRGRLRESEALRRKAMALHLQRGARLPYYNTMVGLAEVDVALRGDGKLAAARLDSMIAANPLDSVPVANRPYLNLARIYAKAGDLKKAEQFLAEYERAIPEVIVRTNRLVPAAKGAIALGQSRPAEAIAQFRRARIDADCGSCWLFEIAQAFDALSQPDSAMATYQEYLDTPQEGPGGRQFALLPTYRRLGELYESKGDRKRALEYYGRFVDLWKDADPELQPKVTDVRKRIAQLAGEPK